MQSLPIPGRSHSGGHKSGCTCTHCRASVTRHCPLHIIKTITFILVNHIAQNITILFEHFKMIRCSISQRTKILWFYAETKPIKLSQQKFQEHFNVAQAPRKPTILSLVDKFLTNGSEMLDSLILTFPKEGIENVLVSLSSFFYAFVFSYCCFAPFNAAVNGKLELTLLKGRQRFDTVSTSNLKV